jgi:hypothetical protein
MKFTSENQPKKRTPRGKAKRNRLIESLQLRTLELLDEQLQGFDVDTAKACIALLPKPKPCRELTPFTLDENAEPAELSRQILAAVAAGHIPSDIGKELISAVADVVKIHEATELEARLAALEAKQ